MKNNRKGFSRLATIIVIAVVCILMAGGAALMALGRGDGETRQRGRGSQELPTAKRCVADYDLEVGDRTTVMNKWSVYKSDWDGVLRLNIYCTSSYQTNDCRDHVSFIVFDNAGIAEQQFDKLYGEFKNYSGVEDQGDNWFLGWEPGVCDASIKQIVLLEGNVLITAEVEIYGEFCGTYDGYEPTEPATPVFDTTVLKDYVIENSADLYDYVINVILEA